mmetsp:Transcript_11986/g.19514  ORF Transcript_11986/g.19514 Transcript_11986/m.19514 type:complete len:218 (+) Transcript_11986:260-913(+)|eukprot:CAMPEP_0203779186 /NCGR_PEP_ID=MMETSP0099_2-20121227/8516_1 /ASSEMBLY_ACC=CAM_ASM_000209 /TAXON_ID=96639 /ORGANISM=" , Strain NY0313808BC1" /LENGTH=217 /DNA_ID=CAMNT_0050678985 /DNA_START=189 /DNA_END=842 /DNA_ORIENTATION=-
MVKVVVRLFNRLPEPVKPVVRFVSRPLVAYWNYIYPAIQPVRSRPGDPQLIPVTRENVKKAIRHGIGFYRYGWKCTRWDWVGLQGYMTPQEYFDRDIRIFRGEKPEDVDADIKRQKEADGLEFPKMDFSKMDIEEHMTQENLNKGKKIANIVTVVFKDTLLEFVKGYQTGKIMETNLIAKKQQEEAIAQSRGEKKSEKQENSDDNPPQEHTRKGKPI